MPTIQKNKEANVEYLLKKQNKKPSSSKTIQTPSLQASISSTTNYKSVETESLHPNTKLAKKSQHVHKTHKPSLNRKTSAKYLGESEVYFLFL